MIGSNLALPLPNSRMQENEADKIGLIFAAMAGYDPEAAIPFWQRMGAINKNKIPEFLSTHPSDETRIKKLSEVIPEIKSKYYKFLAFTRSSFSSTTFTIGGFSDALLF